MLTLLPGEVQLEVWLAAWAVDPTGRTAAALRATAKDLAANTRGRFAHRTLATTLPPPPPPLWPSAAADAAVRALAFMEAHLQPPAPFAGWRNGHPGAAAAAAAALALPAPTAAQLWYVADTIMGRLADVHVQLPSTPWSLLAFRYLQACARHGHLPLAHEDQRRVVDPATGTWQFGPSPDPPALTAQRLLSRAGVPAAAEYDVTPLSIGVLWVAAACDQAGMVQWLLEAGADVHALGDLALRQAAALGAAAAAAVLLDAGAQVHVNADEPMMRAVHGGHAPVVRLLLRHGAATSSERFRALPAAAARGHLAVVRTLLEERPADVDADVHEALCLAAVRSDPAVVELLSAVARVRAAALHGTLPPTPLIALAPDRRP
jgi:hypothetical protein